mgnify:CR=1 FL=1
MRRLPLRSPPRMRGKVHQRSAKIQRYGITPACAGKSMYRTTETPWSRDHPRVCGEKPNDAARLSGFAGSPPRVRGKGLLQVFVSKPFGITPACAGKSRIPSNAPTRFGDHPRVCGEKG